MFDYQNKKLSKREFLNLTKRYGMSSVMLASAGIGGVFSFANIASAAESTYEKRFKKEAKFTLKFGASGFSPATEGTLVTGGVHFARDLEERTDGEIRVEYIGQNQICGELSCVKKTQAGIVDMFTAATQNSAGGAPYLNVLDYAYMFPSRAAQYNFMYHPDSEKLLREPLRKRHGIHMLFSHCELRGLMLGASWKDKPRVTSINDLAGTKNRVTGTQLGRITMQLLGLNPVPVAWEETLDGLKQGLIDGAETWASAAAYANMAPVLGQVVDLRMFSGTEATSINASVFDGLPGELQDAVMESAYQTQIYVQNAQEAALMNVVGASNPQGPNTIFGKANLPFVELSKEALKEAEERSSPEFNPQPWDQWRERLNNWSGGHDTYAEIHKIAREVSPNMLAQNVEPRRWWRS